MKRTPLYDAHIALGARMVEFGGWDMPLQYTTILDEHRAVRERAGMFDVSHMGDLLVRGPGAEEALRGLLTNDIRGLLLGKGIYAHILDERGMIIDDTITFRLGPEAYLLIPNASHVAQIWNWVKDRVRGAEVIDVSDRLACIALQGPKASEVLQRLTPVDLKNIKRLRGELVDLKVTKAVDEGGRRFLPDLCASPPPAPGTVQCYVTRSGYTGEDGFEVLMANGAAPALWKDLLIAGKGLGLQPAGLGARDLLRLEMGYLLSGTDFDGSQTSLETGPEWVVKWDHQFIGRGALLEQKGSGPFRRLVGIELTERGIPRHGHPVAIDHREVGRVTSGTLSPILNRGIALAYLDQDQGREGQEVAVIIRDSSVKGRVVRPPFIRRG